MPRGRISALCGTVAVVVAITGASRAAPEASPTVEVIQTTRDHTQELTRLPDLAFTDSMPTGIPVIDVDDGVRYQQIAGLGAAMTDSSAWLMHNELPVADEEALVGRLFGTAGGIGLDFLRVPIGASDFTRNGRPYSYDDRPRGASDPRLSRFSIAHDRGYIVPILRQALASNPAIKLLANPWSPPAWMKTNDALDNADFHGRLRVSAYGSLARYFVRFIRAYASAGLPIWAVTPQNEPMVATDYPGMQLPEPAEAEWIVHDLRPALRAAGLNPRVYGYEAGWDSLAYARALARSLADRALTGISWHCYYGSPTVMARLHRVAPAMDEIVDECAQGVVHLATPEILISSLRNWASVVALWNLALNPRGGPVQLPNHGCVNCRGLVTIDERTHTVSYGLPYYQLGQVSEFVRPGAWRIRSNNFVAYRYTHPSLDVVSPGLDDAAFLNPDGTRVLVAYNNSGRSIEFAVRWREQSFTYTLAPHATVTFVWGAS